MLNDTLRNYIVVGSYLPNFSIVANFRARRRGIPHIVRARARPVRRDTIGNKLAEPVTETDGAGRTASTDFSFRVAGHSGGILKPVLVVAYPIIGLCCDK